MASLPRRLEAIHPANGRGTTSREGDIHSPVGGDVTNLLLLDRIQKQNEQIQCQNEQLQKMMEARGKALLEDNSHMFKKLASLHPPTYDGALNPKAFEDWVQGMEKLLYVLQCLKEWRVGFAGFYLREDADLWWAIVRNRQYEVGFGWREFKDQLKNRFYPISLQKAEEDEFIRLQRGRMTVLEYASKFSDLSYFAPAYIDDEKLKMNWFEAGLNLLIKEKMSVQHYTLYEDMYDNGE